MSDRGSEVRREIYQELHVERLSGGYVVQTRAYGRGYSGYSVEKVVHRNLGDVLKTMINFFAHPDKQGQVEQVETEGNEEDSHG